MATSLKRESSISVRAAQNAAAIPIITYHSIDSSGSVISTSPDVFIRQMGHLSYSGYTAISLRELARSLRAGVPLDPKTVVLTFDDGFRNFYTEAFPILSKYRFSATVFVVTDFCGKHNDWPGNPDNFPRTKLLSWKEIKELDARGIEIGSHTRTHQDLTRLSEIEITAELLGSITAIADKLGRKPATFAYPFGKVDVRSRRLVEEYFDAACSTVLGKVGPRSDLFRLSRIDSYYLANQRLFEIIPSAAFDNYMRVRQAMRTVRSLIVNR